MSKDEKKSNLADLLEEYFPGAGQKAERILNEVFADYEPEKPEASDYNTSDEIIDGEGLEEFEDMPDVPEEPFEIPESEEEDDEAELREDVNAAEGFSAAATWTGNGISEETADAAETFTEITDIENDGSGEFTDADAVDKASEKAENTAEADVSEEITETEESGDVNEIWIKRFARGVFPVKGDSVFEVIRKIIFLAAIAVFIGAGVMLVSTLVQSQKAMEIQNSIHDIITTTVATYIDDNGIVQTIPPTKEEEEQHNADVAKNFKEINEDYIGYLEVSGCDIYEPVVKGDDNTYYLKNNIYGEQNKAGTIFMDYRCTVTPEYTSPNIVIYGHNQEDGTMFGRLKYYKATNEGNIDFYKQHPVVKFNPEFETNEYLIYAFFVTNALANQDSNGEVFHYHDYIETMNDESTFNWYQNEVKKRNQIISPVDVRYGDKLLVLSTCSNEFTNSRFVVFARKLREGESVSDYDFSETYYNYNAQGVDWEAIMSGETSATTVPPEEIEEILDESTTRRKTINKRNEKTYTKASEEETETAEETTEVALPADAAVTAVPVSEASGAETETAGSSEDAEGETETTVPTDENGESVPETDDNGDTVTYSDSESDTDTSESSVEPETSSKKKRTETSETSEVVTSKKKSNKSNR